MLSKTQVLNKFSGDLDVEEKIRKLRKETDDSFYLCNLSDVIRKFDDWVCKLPRVKPFYAVKCNDNIEVLKALASLGCSFDCASSGEIAKILSLKVDPSRIIFANTTKASIHIKSAKKCKVNLMTFDNEDELYKILKIFPKADLVLRLRPETNKARYDLGKKYGCHASTEAPELLQTAKSLGLNVVGTSFHVGSCCEDYDAWCDAIKSSREVFDVAKTVGFKFTLLDIGGGLLGDNFTRIENFGCKVSKSIDENFPIDEFADLKVIAEPGRYFVESAFTLAASVHSRKLSKSADTVVMYYINEGIYSSFLYSVIGSEVFKPEVLKENRSSEKFNSTIWGPTCSTSDIVRENVQLPMLSIGDTIYFRNMGAYAGTLVTRFNGF